MIDIEADVSSLVSVEKLFRQVGNQAPHAIRRAVNRVGDKARTLVTRTLAKQTGAKYGAVRKALSIKRANYSSLAYRIMARGAHLSLKEFGPRQTRKVVSAAPWGKRRVFPHAFISTTLGGHVFVRAGTRHVMARGRYAGKLRQPLHKMYGPALPNELTKAETAAAFLAQVRAQLAPEVARQIEAILMGHAPRG